MPAFSKSLALVNTRGCADKMPEAVLENNSQIKVMKSL
jgi:hypothetical protein